MAYTFYDTGGHGYLRVTYDELVYLGIHNDISKFSYTHSSDHPNIEFLVYLEEDADLGLFLKAKNLERNQMFVKELEYFLKCVRNRNNTFNDVSEGKKTLQVILGAKKSSQTKKMINVSY